jgi:hypothetical protein
MIRRKVPKSKTKSKAKPLQKKQISKAKPLPKLIKDTQQVFNKYVRTRDQGLVCISCGKDNANQAGHYFPVKGFSALRFHEWNVNLQCAGCNMYLHGNMGLYRVGLVNKIGESAVKELESIAIAQRIKKWDREELEELINKYK